MESSRDPFLERPPMIPAPLTRRRLTLFDVLCIGVNATVGSGIFALPDDIQRAMGGLSPLAYLLCALLLLPVALCFAELAGRVDETGGAYIYARRAFGDRVGFLVGWYCWANTFVSWAANTTLFMELLGPHIGLSASLARRLLAVALIAALGAVNYVGVKPGARVVALVVIGKIGAILCFLLVAVFAMDPSRLGGPLPHGIAGLGQGIYLALFPVQGFEVAPVTAGETTNPRRNVPLGVLGSLLFSTLLFVIVQAVLVGSYPRLAVPSQQPLTDGAFFLSPRLGLVVLVGSFLSIGGFTAGSALGSPRFAEAIAAHGLLPAALARIHVRFSTPHIAIIVTTAATAVLAFFFDYRRLVGMSNITVVVQYLFACLAVPVLRKQERGSTPPSARRTRSGFVMPGGPLIPWIGAASSLAFFAAADRTEFAFAGATLMVGIGIAAATQAQRPRPA